LVVRLAAERFPPELRLLLEVFRAPADDARVDWDRLLRDAGLERELRDAGREREPVVPERGFALAPFALEPLRLDPERPPERPLPLDELRRPVEPLFCPDFELP
jgi:hypothetical protein